MGVVRTLPGVKLPTPAEPHAILVEVLKGLLADAEKGELQCFIGVGLDAEGARTEVWVSGEEDCETAYCALVSLERSYFKRNIEADEDES